MQVFQLLNINDLLDRVVADERHQIADEVVEEMVGVYLLQLEPLIIRVVSLKVSEETDELADLVDEHSLEVVVVVNDELSYLFMRHLHL